MPALRLCPDEWMARLGVDLFDEHARTRVEGLTWHVGRSALQLGLNVILENGFWSRAERDALRAEARTLGADVELRALIVPLDELWRRVERRNRSADWATAPISRAQLESWWQQFEPPSGEELDRYDPPLSTGADVGAGRGRTQVARR